MSSCRGEEGGGEEGGRDALGVNARRSEFNMVGRSDRRKFEDAEDRVSNKLSLAEVKQQT